MNSDGVDCGARARRSLERIQDLLNRDGRVAAVRQPRNGNRYPPATLGLPQKRSISAAGLRAFDPLSQPRARLRDNVRESGTQNSVPKSRLSLRCPSRRHLFVV
jgi:hypothetical protein